MQHLDTILIATVTVRWVSLLYLQAWARGIQSSKTFPQQCHVALTTLLFLYRHVQLVKKTQLNAQFRSRSFTNEVTSSSNSFWTSSVRDLGVHFMWLKHNTLRCFYVFLGPRGSLAFQRQETVQQHKEVHKRDKQSCEFGDAKCLHCRYHCFFGFLLLWEASRKQKWRPSPSYIPLPRWGSNMACESFTYHFTELRSLVKLENRYVRHVASISVENTLTDFTILSNTDSDLAAFVCVIVSYKAKSTLSK